MEEGKEYHIALGKGDIGEYVILPGDPGRVPKIAKYFDNAKKVAENREYTTYTGEVDGIKVSATSTGIGCPSAAIAVEELAKIGAHTFIRVGTCGSLQPEIKTGEIVISTGAIRGDGTSLSYVPVEYPAVPDFDVTLALREAATRLGYPYHLGISHCKDAFYLEYPEILPMEDEIKARWKMWQRANVAATSMEASAVFVVSAIRKLRAGEVMAVIGATWNDEPIKEKAGVEEAIKTAIEAIKILHARDLSASS